MCNEVRGENMTGKKGQVRIWQAKRKWEVKRN